MKNKVPDVTTKFKRYLMLEKSLAANTVEAYMSDLKKLTDFIKASDTDMLSVSYHDLQEFAATLNDVGIHPRSQMRIISGIRGFFRFLVLDGYLEKDPSELLSSPKPGRHIPEVLSLEEIDMMVSAIDASTAEGQRNKAIIETLYGCGLRVSELCNLHLSDLINFQYNLTETIQETADTPRTAPPAGAAVVELGSLEGLFDGSPEPAAAA